MRKTSFLLGMLAVMAGAQAQTANFTPGNLVVAGADVIPSTSGGTSSVSATTVLSQFSLTPMSASSYTLAFDGTGSNRFTASWSATSMLNLQYNGGFLSLAGFDRDSALGGTNSTTASSTNRTVALVPLTGSVNLIRLSDAFNADVPRSAVTDGSNVWAAGNGSPATSAGIRFSGTTGTTSTAIQSTLSGTVTVPSNNRVASIANGNLYFSSGSGTNRGIWAFTGTPTTTATPNLIVNLGASGSPYDFGFSNPNTVYVADDRALASGGGLLKYTFNSGTGNWDFAYALNIGFTTSIRSLAIVDSGSGTTRIAVITNESTGGTGSAPTLSTPNQIWLVNDNGSVALSTSVKLQDGPTNRVWRGIRYVPNVAPSTQTLSGTLNLQDTVGAFASSRTTTWTLKNGTAVVQTGTVVSNGASTALTIALPSGLSGSHTLEFDGNSFLLRKVNISLNGSNQSLGAVNLQNGDCDNSGEVDAADIDLVIADFGGSGITTDVDASGEVDAADIDIVIANFGGSNDQ